MDPAVWEQLTSGLPPGAFFVALSSIHWREAWKYGERAYRYCQHDVGHALAALRFAAAALGWRMALLGGMEDDAIAALLGLDRREDFLPGEQEEPELLVVVLPEGGSVDPGFRLGAPALDAVASGRWEGRAHPLSPEHHPWEIIEHVSRACRKPASLPSPGDTGTPGAFRSPDREPGGSARYFDTLGHATATAGKIIRQRRSAVAMDGGTGIPRSRFYAMLQRLIPSMVPVPWDCVPWPPRVHPGLFVHRVDGIPPGLYALVRDPARLDTLKGAMKPAFRWTTPPECPERLPLFLLEEGDVQSLATGVSCDQEIAGDGAFSLGMLAEFEPVLRQYGPWFYRRLFWETGIIGQVLYLEAEAAGIRGTGMGCFFDDPVHQVFGLTDLTFQSLYHFTMGGPVEDPRLTTLPAYGHREVH